ncbi:hypothetical protein C4569_00310 [Candidatus Parcubacteria bacterium]|nr:MAG: hypothetical protein C4569_00310 [Candidatus Parcubacteria bacterium]
MVTAAMLEWINNPKLTDEELARINSAYRSLINCLARYGLNVHEQATAIRNIAKKYSKQIIKNQRDNLLREAHAMLRQIA